jgi:hypothetical protein
MEKSTKQDKEICWKLINGKIDFLCNSCFDLNEKHCEYAVFILGSFCINDDSGKKVVDMIWKFTHNLWVQTYIKLCTNLDKIFLVPSCLKPQWRLAPSATLSTVTVTIKFIS